MKTTIIYSSAHHGNTKMLVESIAKVCEVILIDATKVTEVNLTDSDRIGFASGIYLSKSNLLAESIKAFQGKRI